MDKRYQVFVSSTYTDVREERNDVIETLMKMDCIPTGMDLFPSLAEEHFEFIKAVIDDSDYYLLIMGNHCGDLEEDGLSYIEKTFDYAVSKDIRILALVHEKPESLPSQQAEKTEENIGQFDAFKSKVFSHCLVKFWNNPNELAGLVALNLPHIIKIHPRDGWVRGNKSIENMGLLNQVNVLQGKNIELMQKISECYLQENSENNFPQDNKLMLLQYDTYVVDNELYSLSVELGVVLKFIGLQFINSPSISEAYMIFHLNDFLILQCPCEKETVKSYQITAESVQVLKIQLIALEFIEVLQPHNNSNPVTVQWKVSQKGLQYFSNSMAISN